MIKTFQQKRQPSTQGGQQDLFHQEPQASRPLLPFLVAARGWRKKSMINENETTYSKEGLNIPLCLASIGLSLVTETALPMESKRPSALRWISRRKDEIR
jgi:hypothetical protein